MEKSLNTQNHSLPTILEDEKIKITIELASVNTLMPYPVSDSMIEKWGRSLIRIEPRVTLEEIEGLMDSFMKGDIEYNPKEGIQNIFKGLVQLYPSKYHTPKMVY